MQKNSGNFSMQEALRLANSDAGQRLLATLKQNGGDALHQAVQQAASGDYKALKKALTPLLSDPQVRSILGDMEGKHG